MSTSHFSSIPEGPTELHHKVVAVVTHLGTPVSMGRVRVHPATAKGGARVEVVFHTENVSCAVTVAPTDLKPTQDSAEGVIYRYVLPPGEVLWAADFGPRRVDRGEARAGHESGSPPTGEALVETYPLPPDYRLTGYSATPTVPAPARDSRSPQPGTRGQRSAEDKKARD